MAAAPNAPIPSEILEWLGIEYYNEKNFAAAEKYLSALGKAGPETGSSRSQTDNPQIVKPDFWFYLGDAASKLQNFDEAEAAFSKYLETATDPAGKAKVLSHLVL